MSEKKSKTAVNARKINKAALRVLVGNTAPPIEPYFGENWPWCGGIVYQPKHPMLIDKGNHELSTTE